MITLQYLNIEDLSRPEILKAVKSRKVVIVLDTNGDEDKALIGKVEKYVKACWQHVRPGMDLNLVRIYINEVFDDEPEIFRTTMQHSRKYVKFTCGILGAMLRHHVFQCSSQDLVKTLSRALGYKYDTVERYLFVGMRNSRLREIFIEADSKINKNQLDLCSRFQKQ